MKIKSFDFMPELFKLNIWNQHILSVHYYYQYRTTLHWCPESFLLGSAMRFARSVKKYCKHRNITLEFEDEQK